MSQGLQMWKTPVLAFAAILLTSQLSQAQSLPSPWTTGIATNYGGAQDGMNPSSPSFGTKDGSCGFGLLNQAVYPYWSVAALATSSPFFVAGPSGGCGQCFEIQCSNTGGQFAGRCGSSQSITVTITDSCPECGTNHIDIQALTFNKIAPMAIGRIDIKYRRVECTPPLPVSISVDNNVGVGGWLRLVVEKTAGFGGITAVAIRNSAATWQSMNNKFGSAWEVSNTPQLPWDFRFTSDSGQTITANQLISSIGQVGSIPTGVQFSLSGQGDSAGQVTYGQTSGSTTSGAGVPPTSTIPGSTPPAGGTTSAAGGATPPTPAGGATPPLPGSSPTPLAATPPVAGGATPAAAGSCPCNDVQPTAAITCAQQQAYGKCKDSWMTSGNFCQLTCGNCPASCSAGGSTNQQQSQQSAGPPLAGSQQTPPSGATPPPAGATPPPSGAISPPPGQIQAGSGYATPPASPASPSIAGSGSVQTQSIGGSSTCTDNPPSAGQSCSSLAAVSGACGSSLQQGTCDKSCYRC